MGYLYFADRPVIVFCAPAYSVLRSSGVQAEAGTPSSALAHFFPSQTHRNLALSRRHVERAIAAANPRAPEAPQRRCGRTSAPQNGAAERAAAAPFPLGSSPGTERWRWAPPRAGVLRPQRLPRAPLSQRERAGAPGRADHRPARRVQAVSDRRRCGWHELARGGEPRAHEREPAPAQGRRHEPARDRGAGGRAGRAALGLRGAAAGGHVYQRPALRPAPRLRLAALRGRRRGGYHGVGAARAKAAGDAPRLPRLQPTLHLHCTCMPPPCLQV